MSTPAITHSIRNFCVLKKKKFLRSLIPFYCCLDLSNYRKMYCCCFFSFMAFALVAPKFKKLATRQMKRKKK